jgi:plastocyanin
MSTTQSSDLGPRSRAKRRLPARTAGRLVVVAGLLAGPLALPPLMQQASAADHQVNIQNLQFNPADITANVGDQVIWTSHDPDTHGVTGGPMNSPDLHQGDTFRFTISQPGDITYGCRFHPAMHGTIKVAGGGGGGGAPAPQPGGPAPAPAPPAPAPGGAPDIGALLAQLLAGLLGGIPHSVPGPAPVVTPAATHVLPLFGGMGDLATMPAAPHPAAVSNPDDPTKEPKPDAAPKPGEAPKPEPEQQDLLPKLDLPKLGALPKLPLPGGAPELPVLPVLGSLLDPGNPGSAPSPGGLVG